MSKSGTNFSFFSFDESLAIPIHLKEDKMIAYQGDKNAGEKPNLINHSYCTRAACIEDRLLHYFK